MNEIKLKTTKVNEFINITLEIREILEESGVNDGICIIFVPHTTAGLSVVEGVDPDVTRDVVMALERQFPWEDGALHLKDGYTANAKAVVVGSSETFIIKDGKFNTGAWQQIFFCEFNGPRRRKVFVKIIDDRNIKNHQGDEMKLNLSEFSLKTGEESELTDISGEVGRIISDSRVSDGFCIVDYSGTSAGITLNDTKAGIVKGVISELDRMVPGGKESTAPQVKASIVGNSETLIIEGGEICRGSSQKILFYEMNGPGDHRVMVKTMGN